MIFRKMGCLVVTSNLVKLKSISSWPNFRAKTTENHFRFHFHFKWLPALENRREREREKERRDRDITGTAPSVDIIGIVDGAVPTSPAPRMRWSRSAHRANELIAIARSFDRADRDLVVRNLAFVCSDLMIFFGFCLCFEEWMILYIRLVTEKMWENVSNK